MAEWDHRAGTASGVYQLYLYVTETGFLEAGPSPASGVGRTRLSWELGIIKVAGSGGVGSTSNNTNWEVKLYGNNNGETSGTGAFSFGANDAIGTRRALATGSDWIFSHDGDYSGRLSINTYARAVTNISLGSAQIGWGLIGMTPFSRNAQPPKDPEVTGRPSDSQIAFRAWNSSEWGLGTTAVQHMFQLSENSNLADVSTTTYPTTGGNAAHTFTKTGLTPHKTYYARDGVRARSGNNAWSNIIAIYARPSRPAAPVVTAKTPTSLTMSAANPSYVGAGITQRQTQLSLDDFATIVQTSNHLTTPSFTGLTRVRPYKVRTRVLNGVDWSEWSLVASTPTPGTAPTAPTAYTLYDIAATSAKVTLGTISDNGGVTPSQVRVKVSTTASDTGLIQTVTMPTWVEPRLSGLTKGTTYFVAEAAYNTADGGGWGPYGGWVQFTTLANVPNGPVLSSSSVAGTFATLQWLAPTQLNGAEINSYRLRVATNQGLTTGIKDYTIAPDTLSQVVTGLAAGTQYWAEVYTETSNGRGSASAIVTFTTTGGGGATSGIWLDIAGVPKFCEVWYSGSDGVPKLSEPWYSGNDGVPKICGM